ncbi:MAG: EamA family transporter [Candidatus Omnitrophota bacterium]|nr:EamA family transporter [Candidatus Omnitrophota bacterium]
MAKKFAGIFLLKVIALIIIKDTIESFGDLFFKMGTLSTGISNVTMANVLEFASRVTSNPWLWVGVILYLANFFLWIALLSRVDLSIAFPMSSLTYIIVPFLAIAFLQEKVAPIRWAGILFIIIGVSLSGRAASNNKGGVT